MSTPPTSASAAASISVQTQIRRNATDQQTVLSGLSDWEKSMKLKDSQLRDLKSKKMSMTPDIRNSKSNSNSNGSTVASGGGGGIRQASPSDYEVPSEASDFLNSSKKTNGDDRKVYLGTGTSLSSNDGDAKPVSVMVNTSNAKVTPVKTQSEQSTLERQRGNTFYTSNNYTAALKCYTLALTFSLPNASKSVLYSNKSMCHLKLKDWSNAEKDASTSISLDVENVKSYQRRSSARMNLGKHRASLNDLYLAKGLIESSGAGGLGAVNVEVRKGKESLRSVIRRAPRVGVVVRIGSGGVRKVVDSEDEEEEEEEEEVLELGDGGFDVKINDVFKVKAKTVTVVIKDVPQTEDKTQVKGILKQPDAMKEKEKAIAAPEAEAEAELPTPKIVKFKFNDDVRVEQKTPPTPPPAAPTPTSAPIPTPTPAPTPVSLPLPLVANTSTSTSTAPKTKKTTPTKKTQPPKSSYEFERMWSKLKTYSLKFDFLISTFNPAASTSTSTSAVKRTQSKKSSVKVKVMSLSQTLTSGYTDSDIFEDIVLTFSQPPTSPTSPTSSSSSLTSEQSKEWLIDLATVKNVSMMYGMCDGNTKTVISSMVEKAFEGEVPDVVVNAFK